MWFRRWLYSEGLKHAPANTRTKPNAVNSRWDQAPATNSFYNKHKHLQPPSGGRMCLCNPLRCYAGATLVLRRRAKFSNVEIGHFGGLRIFTALTTGDQVADFAAFTVGGPTGANGPLQTFVDGAVNGRCEPFLPKFCNAANGRYYSSGKNLRPPLGSLMGFHGILTPDEAYAKNRDKQICNLTCNNDQPNYNCTMVKSYGHFSPPHLTLPVESQNRDCQIGNLAYVRPSSVTFARDQGYQKRSASTFKICI